MAAQQITNYDRAPLVLGDVRSRTVTLRNVTAGEVTLLRGQVLGRNADGEYVVLQSTPVDGSQYPKAVLSADTTIAASGTATAQVFISGDFNPVGLVFDGTDTLDTAIDGQPIEDWMKAQSLFVQDVSELTDYDNQ